MAVLIENHYQCPMDIEWGLDGETPRIIHSAGTTRNRTQSWQRADSATVSHAGGGNKSSSKAAALAGEIGCGIVRIVPSVSQLDKVQEGDILVTDMTDPDWEPVMKRTSAIVTNRGGRTCHAAIIARELGVPAVVGCGDATRKLEDGLMVTVFLRRRRYGTGLPGGTRL